MQIGTKPVITRAVFRRLRCRALRQPGIARGKKEKRARHFAGQEESAGESRWRMVRWIEPMITMGVRKAIILNKRNKICRMNTWNLRAKIAWNQICWTMNTMITAPPTMMEGK